MQKKLTRWDSPLLKLGPSQEMYTEQFQDALVNLHIII